MINFGGKKDEGDKNQGISEAMRSMSDQIGRQAQEIKRLQEALETAQQDAAAAEKVRKALADAETRMAQMEAELKRLKDQLAATGTGASSGGKSASTSGGETTTAPGSITGSVSGAFGTSGVLKIGPGTPATSTLATDTPATGGLHIGGTAYVQKAGGKNLRLRSAPGLESTVLDGLPPGTKLTLLAGPHEKDGYPWWQIRTADGREGWVAGTELVTDENQ